MVWQSPKYRGIPTPQRPQARFGAQPPVGRLLARRCGALARNDTTVFDTETNLKNLKITEKYAQIPEESPSGIFLFSDFWGMISWRASEKLYSHMTI